MTRFRYLARARHTGERQSGELTAESPAAARSLLRQASLSVLDLRPVPDRTPLRFAGLERLAGSWLRRRRAGNKAELLESLATLIESGVPLRQAAQLAGNGARVPRRVRRLTQELADELTEGGSLHEACGAQRGWFDDLEIAVLQVAQQSGDLSGSMRRLAERQSRSSALRDKVIAAVTYPVLIGLVTMLVVVLLSTKTLPPIVDMLTASGIEIPRLTQILVWAGGVLASPVTLLTALLTAALLVMALTVLRAGTRSRVAPGWYVRLLPSVCHRLPISALARDLADLIASGVPMAQATHILAPTLRGPGTSRLRASLEAARRSMIGGASLEDAFDDELWFDAEFRRLLAVGQESGELPAMLRRLADRYEERSRRAIDRLASLLEPAAILIMSAIVGTVVLAAVLPLIRMQELIS